MSIVLNAVWQRTLQDRRSVGIAGIALFLAVGFACDYPWGNWVGHTHWAKVGWIPYYSGPISAFDILQNLLLFSPIGFFSTLAFDRRQPLYAALSTLPVAFVGEATQLYSHGRFPSATDLTNNVLGAALAAYLCLRYLPWEESL